MNSNGSVPVFVNDFMSPNMIGTASPALIGAISCPMVAVPEPFIT